MKYFLFLLIIFSSLFLCYGNECDSCNTEASRILNNYKRLESRYFEAANEKLIYFLNRDTILRKYFLDSDSLKFKSLKIKINPILKLDYEARNFKFGENICRYFVFDTINFESVIGYFLNDSLYFFITRGHNDCDIGMLVPDGVPPDWCQDESTFKQIFYKKENPTDCQSPYFNIKKDSNLVFWVDYFYFAFIIVNDQINIYPTDYGPFINPLLGKPNSFIKKMINLQWIHFCARRCPCGGNPWWRFWDWRLFLCKPFP